MSEAEPTMGLGLPPVSAPGEEGRRIRCYSSPLPTQTKDSHHNRDPRSQSAHTFRQLQNSGRKLADLSLNNLGFLPETKNEDHNKDAATVEISSLPPFAELWEEVLRFIFE